MISELLLILTYSVYFLMCKETPDITNIKVMGVFALLQFVYICYSWYKAEKSLVNGYILFIIAFYAFNLGQPILEAFESVAPSKSILGRFDVRYDQFFEASYIGMLFIGMMHCGALISIKRNVVAIKNDALQASKMIISIYRVSIFFLILSFPFYIYELVNNLQIVFRFGYMALYDNALNRVPKIVQMISAYYEPAMMALVFSSLYLKKNRPYILSIAALTVLLPPLLLGGRSNAGIFIGLFLVIYSLFHKINFKQLAFIGVGIFATFVLFAYIVQTRTSAINDKQSFSSTMQEIDNPISLTLSEMGWSMTPLCWCLDIYPERMDYRMGDSFIYSFTTIVPNLGFWKYHPAKIHSELGEWLRDYKNLTYGPGFSLTAEAYVNFGYLGFLFFILYGYIIAKVYRYINKKYMNVNPFLLIASLIFLWFTIKTVRNSFLGTVRALFYYTLPMYWLFKYYYTKTFCSKSMR